jgi:hypothetical protein
MFFQIQKFWTQFSNKLAHDFFSHDMPSFRQDQRSCEGCFKIFFLLPILKLNKTCILAPLCSQLQPLEFLLFFPAGTFITDPITQTPWKISQKVIHLEPNRVMYLWHQTYVQGVHNSISSKIPIKLAQISRFPQSLRPIPERYGSDKSKSPFFQIFQTQI